MTSVSSNSSDNNGTGSPSRPVPQLCKPTTATFQFEPFIISIQKSHILQSKCLCSSNDDEPKPCTFCRCSNELALPQLPEMLFADNRLRIMHEEKKVGIEFTALDALKLVNPSQDLLKVAISDAWREARADSEHINDVIKPFDWTFSTRYKGTLIGNDEHTFTSCATDQRIDVEKLKRREQILFYDDLHLFEDELADHGCTKLSVKIRAMPTGFFVLQRFYLRVDSLMIRIQDTRLYYEVGSSYITREFSVRENKIAELGNVAPSVLTDPDEIWAHLSLVEEGIEKLQI